MSTFMSKWMPDGLAGRFALLLASALIVANVLALLVLSLERARWGRESRDNRELERIVALVPVLESIEPSLRPAVARNASTRVAQIELSDQPLNASTADNVRSRSLQERLSQSLAPRQVFVMVADRRQQNNRTSDSRRSDARRQPPRPAPEIIGVSIQLAGNVPQATGASRIAEEEAMPTSPEAAPLSAGGGWVNITARSLPPAQGHAATLLGEGVFYLILGLSLVSVLVVGLWFVRRLTQPLALLADAAQAAGRGDRSARVPEQGAREVREAAAAFNAMQAQIARFDAERTRTLGAVGHDLRTPITSLRIRAEMLDEEFRDPMVRTLDEMTVMANGLVAFARGNAEPEEMQNVELNELLSHLCQERGASYTPGEHRIIRARPVALQRAFGNLVDNAIRYGSLARMSLQLVEGCAVVILEDDGPGIPEERMETVFEPFVRGDDSRNSETGGAGLGLSIALSIIRSHGGTLTLRNRKPSGLQVSVSLPLTQ
ncbi:ATP-binding protein [Granulosicoccus sp. 3-233]|uniref:ATP-binding protein n=1 Tax=Granulosicoccus sp. 3-233 TaxID=3417969 RepID=UPI003D359539